jgi:hypothetical protein
MQLHASVPTSVAYTPRSCRPELFGACQVREGFYRYAA